MTTNDLPSWLPIFNIVTSVLALALIIPALRVAGELVPAYRGALLVALAILAAGALFQANILPLWAWIVVGSGGRLLVLLLVVAGMAAAWPDRHR